MKDQGNSNHDTLLAALDTHIRFQEKWKTLTMLIYTCSTVGMILASTGATIFAAIKYSNTAAVLAAFATLLVSIEKSLLFREKWKLHLATKTYLENVELDLRLRRITDDQAADQLKKIGQDYAQELPVASRT